jgi:hypothetical protein
MIKVLTRYLGRLQLRRAARKYARLLGPQLRKDYGGDAHFTAGQVRTAVRRTALPERYLAIGYAAFMSEEEFKKTMGDVSEAQYVPLRSVFLRYVGLRTYASWDQPPKNFYVMQSGGGGSGGAESAAE